MILYKLLNKGTFDEVNGCISTGKEANVYHAVDSNGQEIAVKIYKTSILIFKDRDRHEISLLRKVLYSSFTHTPSHYSDM